MGTFRQQAVEIHLERPGLFTGHDPAAACDDRHIANTSTMQRERHTPPGFSDS